MGFQPAGASNSRERLIFVDQETANPAAEEKLRRLKDILRETESLLVAYSGGLDSSFLLWAASMVLGQRVVAVTAVSELHAHEEYEGAREYAGLLGVRHLVIETSELDDHRFAANPPERCYICKKGLCERLLELARRHELRWVADGTHSDDSADYRPGERALRELGIRSPLREAGLAKGEIRLLARDNGVPSWNKPAQPCLATRFPYGTPITRDNLEKVRRAERILQRLGFSRCRVRFHGTIARIEVPPDEFHHLIETPAADAVVREIKALGFHYVTLDLQGYRSGSMDEPLRGL